jgi:hypothetical protein
MFAILRGSGVGCYTVRVRRAAAWMAQQLKTGVNECQLPTCVFGASTPGLTGAKQRGWRKSSVTGGNEKRVNGID